jgi:hypothetical protein
MMDNLYTDMGYMSRIFTCPGAAKGENLKMNIVKRRGRRRNHAVSSLSA